tara:strand:+ start:155 stop:370 length:216 start_codon:yes stop_codon:yes gene_type:complete
MQTTSNHISMYLIDQQLSNIIDRLNEALNVCYTAPDREDEGYPYATGYARSAIEGSVESLVKVQQQLQENM